MPDQELNSLMAAVADLEAEVAALRIPAARGHRRPAAGQRAAAAGAGCVAAAGWVTAATGWVRPIVYGNCPGGYRPLVQSPDQAELGEATAALQDLALGLADPGSAADRLEALAALQAGLDRRSRWRRTARTWSPTRATQRRARRAAAACAADGAVPLRRLGSSSRCATAPTPATASPTPRTRTGCRTGGTATSASR